MANQDQDIGQEQTENRGKRIKKGKEDLPAPKDESSIAFYLNSSLFVFFVTSWTFAMFLHSNRYPLVLNDEISPEIIAVFGILFVFSFLSLFLLSFSRFLSRAFISIVAGTAASYLLGLYCSYNVGEYLASYLSFLPRQQLHSLAMGGNFVVGVAVGAVFFVFVHMLKGGAMALLSLPALCALFFIFNDSSRQKIPEITESKFAAVNAADRDGKKENLVYLLMSDHAGYAYALEKWQPRSVGNPSEDRSPYFINDFYQANKFVFYPHVYSRFQDKYRSVGSVMNPSEEKIGNEMFVRGTSSYYTSSGEARVTLARNELFKKLKDAGYALNVYQSYPVNYCDGAEGRGIARCVSYPAPLGALYNTDLSLFSKVMLLTGHWMNSFPIGRSLIDWGRNKLVAYKVKVNDLPFLGNPYAQSLPVGQAEMLMQLREDVKKAEGKNVFFAHVALPHYPYVYDRSCRLKKDPQTWRSNRAYEGVIEQKEEERRWDGYNQQLFCTYAQLNAALRDWEASGDLKHTKIVIHGDKGASIMPSAKDLLLTAKVDQALERVKRNSATVFAVYAPASKKSEVKPSPCDLGSLVRLHLLGEKPEACLLPDLKSFGEEEKAKLEKWLTAPVAGINYKPKEKYAKTYANWLEMGGQSFLAAADRRRRALNGEGVPSKVSFVAPPFAEKSKVAEKTEKKDTVKTEIVPVPEEKTELMPDLPGETVPPLPEEDLPAPEAVETVDVILEETPSAPPKKMELPEIDPAFARSKWKLIEEAADTKSEDTAVEGIVKTEEQTGSNDAEPTLETLPSAVEAPVSPVVALPDFDEHPVPDAAPVSEVKELPALETTEPFSPVETVTSAVADSAASVPADEAAPAENAIAVLPELSVESSEAKADPSVAVLPEIPETTEAASPAVEEVAEAVMNETEESELTLPALKLGEDVAADDVSETFEAVVTEQAETPAADVDASPSAEPKGTDAADEEPSFVGEIKSVAVTPVEETKEARDANVEQALPAARIQPAAPVKETGPVKQPETAATEDPVASVAEAEQEPSAESKPEAKAKPEEKAKVETGVLAERTTVSEKNADAPAEKTPPAEEALPVRETAETPAMTNVERPEAKETAKKETPVSEQTEKKTETGKEEKTVFEPLNKDELDITREIITERISPTTGQKETYIFIERKRNPNRFRKRFPVQKELKDDALARSVKQKTLDADGERSELTKDVPLPVAEKTLSSETADAAVPKKEQSAPKSVPKTQAPLGRELGSGGLERAAPTAVLPPSEGRVLR